MEENSWEDVATMRLTRWIIVLTLFAPQAFAADTGVLVDELLSEVQKTLVRVSHAVDDEDLPPLSSITLKLQTGLKTGGGGKVSFFVVTAGADVSKESVQSIVLKLKPPRDSDSIPVSSVSDAMRGRKVKIVIEDPWCGVRPQNRKKLADFVGTLERSGISMGDLKIVWNPYADDFETPQAQIRDLEKQLALANVKATPSFESRDKRSGHFHDRVVLMETVDSGDAISGRWDITSGIDNLMSFHKECKVFLELN